MRDNRYDNTFQPRPVLALRPLRGNAVHFGSGAHTFWHRHGSGQTLHFSEGVARVVTRDGRVLEVHRVRHLDAAR